MCEATARLISGGLEINLAYLANRAGKAFSTASDLTTLLINEEGLDPVAAASVAALTISRARDEGLVRFLGFTTEGTNGPASTLVQSGAFDVMQVCYNLLFLSTFVLSSLGLASSGDEPPPELEACIRDTITEEQVRELAIASMVGDVDERDSTFDLLEPCLDQAENRSAPSTAVTAPAATRPSDG